MPQEWIRNIPWPKTMQTKEKRLPLDYYPGEKDAMHEKTVSERIYITGLASSYNKETSKSLHLNIDDINNNITYPDGPRQ